MYSLHGLSNAQLEAYFDNCVRRNEVPMASLIAAEMLRRGIRCGKRFKFFRWNKRSVAEALAPFVQIALTVPDNSRTCFTTGGGGVFRKANGERPNWIDSYSAIKARSVNATFSIQVVRPGMEPAITLTDGEMISHYDAVDISRALEAWRSIAQQAKPQLAAAA